MRLFLYNLKIRRRLAGSLALVACAIAAMIALGSGVLDDKIRRKLDRTLQRKDVELEGLIGRAEGKVRNGRHLEAIAIYLTALDRNPAGQRRHKFFGLKQRARIGLSRSLTEVGEHGKARRIAEVVLREEPEYWYAHKNLGDVLARGGKAEKAAEHYRNALRGNPSDQETLSALTENLAERSLREQLIEAYRQYLQAHALGTLQVRLNDALVFERDIVINGSWQRLRMPHPGSGRLHVTCLFNDHPVGVWLGEINALARDPMTAVFLEDYQPRSEDVVKMRIGTPPALAPTAEIQQEDSAKFLELHLAVSKPWTDEMTKQLKRAAIGNPR